jgi:hypothetical protein
VKRDRFYIAKTLRRKERGILHAHFDVDQSNKICRADIYFCSKKQRLGNVRTHHRDCGALSSDWRSHPGRGDFSDSWEI